MFKGRSESAVSKRWAKISGGATANFPHGDPNSSHSGGGGTAAQVAEAAAPPSPSMTAQAPGGLYPMAG